MLRSDAARGAARPPHRRGRRRGHVDGAARCRSRRRPGTSLDLPGIVDRPARRRGGAAGRRACGRRRAPPARTTASSCCSKGAVDASRPVPLPRRPPRARGRAGGAAPAHAGRQTRAAARTPSTAYRYPVAPFGNQPDQPPMREDGAENALRHLARPAGREHRRLDPRPADRRAHRPVLSRSARREHGAGLRRHAGRRQRADVRLPRAGRRGGRVVPAPGPLLRRRRLPPRPFTGEERSPAATCFARG